MVNRMDIMDIVGIDNTFVCVYDTNDVQNRYACDRCYTTQEYKKVGKHSDINIITATGDIRTFVLFDNDRIVVNNGGPARHTEIIIIKK